MKRKKLSPAEQKRHNHYVQMKKWIADNTTDEVRAFMSSMDLFAGRPDEGWLAAYNESEERAKKILELSKMGYEAFKNAELPVIDHDTLLALMSQVEDQVKTEKNEAARAHGAKRAAELHAPNNRKGEEIRAVWASGSYSSRNQCARHNWERLGFNCEETARDWLLNIPGSKK